MPKTQKTVFSIPLLPQTRQVVAMLTDELPPDAALEFARVALPHPQASGGLEVFHLVTLWFRKGHKATAKMNALAEQLKKRVPEAQFMAPADLALLNARARAVEIPVFGEKLIKDFPDTRPWAMPYLEGDVRPSLLSLIWHGSAKPSFRQNLCDLVLPKREDLYERRFSGRISGFVRYFGTKKFGAQRSPVELTEPLSAFSGLFGEYRATPRRPAHFEELLPLTEYDPRYSLSEPQYARPSEKAIKLVDTTGQAVFVTPCDCTTVQNWVVSLEESKQQRLLGELRESAQAQGVAVHELTKGTDFLPILPVTGSPLRLDLHHLQEQVYLWRMFLTHRLQLSEFEAARMEAALYYAYQKQEGSTTWRHIRDEARELNLGHPVLEALANEGEVVISEFEHVLLRLMRLCLGWQTEDGRQGQLVILPPLEVSASNMYGAAWELLFQLLRRGRKQNRTVVVQLRDWNEMHPQVKENFLHHVRFVATQPETESKGDFYFRDAIVGEGWVRFHNEVVTPPVLLEVVEGPVVDATQEKAAELPKP